MVGLLLWISAPFYHHKSWAAAVLFRGLQCGLAPRVPEDNWQNAAEAGRQAGLMLHALISSSHATDLCFVWIAYGTRCCAFRSLSCQKVKWRHSPVPGQQQGAFV